MAGGMGNVEIIERNNNADQTDEWMHKLLSKLFSEYTEGKSSSVTEEEAKDIFASTVFVLGLDEENYIEKLNEYAKHDPFKLYLSRSTRLENYADMCKHILHKLTLDLAKIENIALKSTLRDIKTYLANYDSKFAPLMLPSGISYPLAIAVPDDKKGIYFAFEYLSRLTIENIVVKALDENNVINVLEKKIDGWRYSTFNIFEVAVANALILTVLREPIKGINAEYKKTEIDDVLKFPEAQLMEAAHSICTELNITHEGTVRYIKEFAISLSRRVRFMMERNLSASCIF